MKLKPRERREKPRLSDIKRVVDQIMPFSVGELVQFYDEGWRAAYVEKYAGLKQILIRPIGPKGSIPHRKTVAIEDVRKV
jgi:hypothetical protein